MRVEGVCHTQFVIKRVNHQGYEAMKQLGACNFHHVMVTFIILYRQTFCPDFTPRGKLNFESS